MRTDEEPEVALEAEAILLRVRDEVWLTLLLAASAALEESLPRPPSAAFCISTERNSLNLLEAAVLSSLHDQMNGMQVQKCMKIAADRGEKLQI